MREIVIISGKGGTGKTSISAAFATLSSRSLIVDCDVDAADMHLVLEPTIEESHLFYGLPLPRIDPTRCRHCGRCQAVCRFGAVQHDAEGFRIDPMACERCTACLHACPQAAITLHESSSGHWYRSQTRQGPMLHARLEPGAENSGRLVTLLRQEARRVAEAEGLETILVDGPPGIGCPVIASLSGASAALVVTEPTAAGLHDLERVVALAARFRVPTMVLINKADLNEAQTGRIEEHAKGQGLIVLGRVPYDRCITDAQLAGLSLPEFQEGPITEKLREIWRRLDHLIPISAT